MGYQNYSRGREKKARVSKSITRDSMLLFRQEGIKKLLGMVTSTAVKDFILQNVSSKKDDIINRFRVNAPGLVQSAEANRNGNIINATPQEMKMKLILKELGVVYEFQKVYYTGMTYYIVDFFLTDYNVVVELDGSQHYDGFAKEYDALRTENLLYLHKINRVIRFDNKELVIDTDIKSKLTKELNIK
jgi:very-short-patch-repair endonuclease